MDIDDEKRAEAIAKAMAEFEKANRVKVVFEEDSKRKYIEPPMECPDRFTFDEKPVFGGVDLGKEPSFTVSGITTAGVDPKVLIHDIDYWLEVIGRLQNIYYTNVFNLDGTPYRKDK